jgi:PTH2 family peptidyl-tRNA hydrolase
MKQAIIFRSDLKIGKGKLAAHAAHAGITGYELVMRKDPDIVQAWLNEGQKKVVLKVEDEKGLIDLFQRVKGRIPCEIIRDAGLTQVEPGTIICMVIGPWSEGEIDKFTKDLKLL